MLAQQENNTLQWRHQNPLTASHGSSTSSGQYTAEAEFDPSGVNVGFSDPSVNPQGGGEFPQQDGLVNLIPNDPGGRCRINGFAMPCGIVFSMKERGTVMDAPVEEVTTMRFKNQQTREVRYTLGIYGALPDGGAGFVPVGARFDEGNYYTVGLGMTGSGAALGIGRALNIAGSGEVLHGHYQARRGPQVAAPVPLPDLKAGVQGLLNRPGCKDFVDAVMALTAKNNPQDPPYSGSDGKTFMDFFNAINNQGKFVLQRGLSAVYAVSGLVDRNKTSIYKGNAQALIRTRDYYVTGDPKQVALALAQNQLEYIVTALHETFHHIGRYGGGWTDETLAKSAFTITGDSFLYPGNQKGKNPSTLDWSGYFDRQLVHKCAPELGRP